MTKQVIYEKKILPYLGKRKMSEITAKDVIDWQNEMMKLTKPDGTTYSPCYLKTLHAELSALFNHAAKYYQLRTNPARIAGCMGQEVECFSTLHAEVLIQSAKQTKSKEKLHMGWILRYAEGIPAGKAKDLC